MNYGINTQNLKRKSISKKTKEKKIKKKKKKSKKMKRPKYKLTVKAMKRAVTLRILLHKNEDPNTGYKYLFRAENLLNKQSEKLKRKISKYFKLFNRDLEYELKETFLMENVLENMEMESIMEIEEKTKIKSAK